MNNQIMTELGLSPEQASIYESLLENGPQSAVGLAKTSQVLRTHVYNVCRQLAALGLVREEKKGNTTQFVALNPDKLLDIAASKREQFKRIEQTLDETLPKLKALYASTEAKPVVTYYEGPEGIMKANMQILEEKQTILAYLVVNKKIDQAMDKYWSRYYKKRLEENIHVRALTPDTPEGIEYQKKDQEELRITKLVPKETFPFTIEKNIAGNKVAFFSVKNRVLIATIIENKEIAETERSIFELAWQQADNYLTK